MTDYSKDIDDIKNAKSLEDIRAIARRYSAKAEGEGGILYSTDVPPVGHRDARKFALEEAAKSNLPIIDNTPRGQFLADGKVRAAISKWVGIQQSAWELLDGTAQAPPGSPTSFQNSLSGEALREFIGSLHGNVKVIGPYTGLTGPGSLFAQVQIPTDPNDPLKKTMLAAQAQGGSASVVVSLGGYARRQEIPDTHPVAARKPDSAEIPPTPPAESPLKPTNVNATVATAAGTEVADKFVHLPGGTGSWLEAGTAIKNAAEHHYNQLNDTAAISDIQHALARVGGSIAGAALVRAAAAVAEVDREPRTKILAAITATALSYGLDKGVDAYENWKIYNQEDMYKRSWQYKPDPDKPGQGAWTRQEETGEGFKPIPGMLLTTIPSVHQTKTVYADPELTNRLNYQACSTSIELNLGHSPALKNPWHQPSNQAERGAGNTWGDWERDPASHLWSRQVRPLTSEFDERSPTGITEIADPETAKRLNKAAAEVIAQNMFNSPKDMAERFKAMYERKNWGRYGEDMPSAVKAALDPKLNPDNEILASDGNKYSKGEDGKWHGHQLDGDGAVASLVNGVVASV